MAPHHLADVRASRTIRRTMLRRNQLSCITKGGCRFPIGVRASFFAKARCALVPLDRLGDLDGDMWPLRARWRCGCSPSGPRPTRGSRAEDAVFRDRLGDIRSKRATVSSPLRHGALAYLTKKLASVSGHSRCGAVAQLGLGPIASHYRIRSKSALADPVAKALTRPQYGGGVMHRGLLAPLSTREELSLRKIACGVDRENDDCHIVRLRKLGLVQNGDQGWGLTALGRVRCTMLSDPPPLLAVRRGPSRLNGTDPLAPPSSRFTSTGRVRWNKLANGP